MEAPERLREVAAGQWPEQDWSGAAVHHGAFHLVLVPDAGPVLRATLGSSGLDRSLREARVLRRIAALGLAYAVPDVVAGPTGIEGAGVVLIERLPGEAAEDPSVLDAGLLDDYAAVQADLGSVDVDGLDLPGPREWCGGERWPELVAEVLVPLLGEAGAAAQARVAAVIEAEDGVDARLCHGDLGPHNLLREGGRVTGLIDWDHACLGDPAIDLAPLVGFHGADAVAGLADADTLARARVHRATLSLQVAAAAHLCGLRSLRDHALGSFVRRHQEGTLEG